METSGSWVVRRTRKKQLCFAWPHCYNILQLVFYFLETTSFSLFAFCVFSLAIESFPAGLSTLPWGFISLFVNSVPLTLQDWSEIANVYLAQTYQVSVQSVAHNVHTCNPHPKGTKWCYPHFTDVSAEAQRSNLPKVTQLHSQDLSPSSPVPKHVLLLSPSCYFSSWFKGEETEERRREARIAWDMMLGGPPLPQHLRSPLLWFAI